MKTQQTMLVRYNGIVGIVLSLAMASISIANAQSEEAFLSFVSEPGDFIGGGQSLTFTTSDSEFNAMTGQDNREIAISVFPFSGGFWFLNIAAPAGQQLVPGVYEDATRWPFQAPFEPGLSFFGDGRGCNTLTGRFEVVEAVYGQFGFVERFHATFEQHCEGADPALFGEIQIVNPPPPPSLALDLTIDRMGSVRRVTGTATVKGTIMCSEATTVEILGTVTQRASRFALSTGSFGLSVECSPTRTRWSAQVVSSGIPFNPGPAQIDATASAFDPNFGIWVTVQTNALVYLTGSRR